jgi:hypothetical protein
MGLWHVWGFHREWPVARQVGHEVDRQTQDTRTWETGLAQPGGLDQEPLCIREEDGLWDTR